MNARSTLITATILAGIAAAIVPASAEPARSFDAWGHRFTVPGTEETVTAPATNPSNTASIAPKRSYTSAKAGEENAHAVPAPATRTLNVWGARVNVPTY
ncbi:hypothetical protein MBUL_01421 [Methylobacterium bullatum]|uniref:Uncharacterized protein n=1 Tax=Methylobacterium bullatum TaxID=570505 RepID=A0A679ISZ3_9HYPH|nr:hypothetical protein MBUL_01421 [Methylobacterium bullatum]